MNIRNKTFGKFKSKVTQENEIYDKIIYVSRHRNDFWQIRHKEVYYYLKKKPVEIRIKNWNKLKTNILLAHKQQPNNC